MVVHESILVFRTWDPLDFWQLTTYMWDPPINTKTKLLFPPCELINHMSVWLYRITMWLAAQNSNVAMLNYRYVHYWKGNGSLSFMNANFTAVNYYKFDYTTCTTSKYHYDMFSVLQNPQNHTCSLQTIVPSNESTPMVVNSRLCSTAIPAMLLE